jgi:nicotinamidase-related amidase
MRPQPTYAPLSPYNCSLVLIDYQPQYAFAINSSDVQSLISNAVNLAKTAKIFSIPTILTTIGSKSFGGAILPQFQELFPDQKPIDRSTMSVLEDSRVVDALEKARRRNLIVAGLWTDFCVCSSALHALKTGYAVCIVGDACGDVTSQAHNMAIKRLIHAGAVLMTWPQVHLELLRNGIFRKMDAPVSNVTNPMAFVLPLRGKKRVERRDKP